MPDLLGLTAELVGIPSVSGQEAAMADRVVDELGRAPWLSVERIGDSVVASSSVGAAERLLLAGHLDTVPPLGNEGATVEGDTCRGIGAADMKGGLAVLIALATSGPPRERDLTFVFYACEEVDRTRNALRAIGADRPGLLACDAAVLCEPTGCAVEAGCQGSIRVEIGLRGARAHTARPWKGRNAIHRMGPLIETIAELPERRPVIDGCEYRESLQAVEVSGGVAGNVVPDLARLVLNYRFAPDCGVDEAFSRIGALVAPHLDDTDSLKLVDATGGALPSLEHPLLRSLVLLSGEPARAKLGLTDVSFFAELGVPAANFGPADPQIAHSPAEFVDRRELERAYSVLSRLTGIA